LCHLRDRQADHPQARPPIIKQSPPLRIECGPLQPRRHHGKDPLVGKSAQRKPQSHSRGTVNPLEILDHDNS